MFRKEKDAENRHVHYSFFKIFPWFILWFLAASMLNTFGVINPGMSENFVETGKFMIVVALTAIGLHSDIRKMLATGYKPMLLGLITWAAVAATPA